MSSIRTWVSLSSFLTVWFDGQHTDEFYVYFPIYFKIICCALYMIQNYNWPDLFDLDRRSLPYDWEDNISLNLIYICWWILMFYLYMIYILHVYYNSTSLIWTGGGYRYDWIMEILYRLIVRLYYNNSDLRLSV